MGTPVRSDSFSSKGLLEPRPARSESLGKRVEPPRRSDSFSRAGGEPPLRRGYLSLSLKSTVFGLFLLCSCVFLLVHDVRYAPLVLRMFQEDQASALPGVQHGHLIYPNATDHQENSNQEFKVGILHNSTTGALLSSPFSLEFSSEAFTVREVRRLWAVHGCKRALVIHNDSLEKGFRRTSCLCDDWTALAAPILHFRGAIGSGAIQLLLKNAHPAMRRASAQLLGNPAIPSSRPNTFGELFRAFIAPNADIAEAVQWALKGGPDPDITLHLRMLHSRTNPAPLAASSCINRIRGALNPNQLTSKRRLRVVVVTDTPAIIPKLQRALGQSMEVVRFDYLAYAKQMTNRSEVMSLSYGVPQTKLRRRDWGEMPRWVAMVDFFLAARARSAVVSGAYRRVSTTYAQLVGALANANTLESQSPCVYYSSLQSHLVAFGLKTQSGWGHTWRPFGGKLGCRNQEAQCARTALLPYTWWDAPWQSPISQDMIKLKGVAGIDALGQVSERRMDQFCAEARRRGPLPSTKLQVPSYDDAIAEDAGS